MVSFLRDLFLTPIGHYSVPSPKEVPLKFTPKRKEATVELEVESRSSGGNLTIKRFLEITKLQKGKGEIGGNNAGQVVADYKRMATILPGKDLGAWCASGTSWCIERAYGGPERVAAALGISLAAWNKRRHGAKALAKMLEKFGKLKPHQEPEPGMVALWHRGKAGSWQGHISPVIDVNANGAFTVMQFNRGGYPAVVHESRHVTDEGGLLGFYRIA